MWRAHWWCGRFAGLAILLFCLKEPILSALPDRVAALAPMDLGTWLLGVAGTCVLARWSTWACEVRKDPHEKVTIRLDPPYHRVTVRVRPPAR
jgi:hypothetical protein